MIRKPKVTIFAFVVLVSSWVSPNAGAQSVEDWDWTNKQFGPVLDELMPLQKPQGLYVTYRANRDYATSTPEYWFLIGYEPRENGYGLNGFLSAHVRLASPASIYDQLMAMHQKEPASQDVGSFRKRIRLKAYDFTETNCPAVKSQIEKLEKLVTRLPNLNGDVVIIHPRCSHHPSNDPRLLYQRSGGGYEGLFHRRRESSSQMGFGNTRGARTLRYRQVVVRDQGDFTKISSRILSDGDVSTVTFLETSLSRWPRYHST
jgi:hypothetical protein